MVRPTPDVRAEDAHREEHKTEDEDVRVSRRAAPTSLASDLRVILDPAPTTAGCNTNAVRHEHRLPTSGRAVHEPGKSLAAQEVGPGSQAPSPISSGTQVPISAELARGEEDQAPKTEHTQT